MKKSLLPTVLLTLTVSLSACSLHSGRPVTDTSASAKQTSSESGLPSSSTGVAVPDSPLEAVTVSNPSEWNAFAASFNSGSIQYGERVEVTVTRALDFTGISFVPLCRTFNGVIKGSSDLSAEITSSHNVYYSKFIMEASGGGGFFNISQIERVSGKPAKVYAPTPYFLFTDYPQTPYEDGGDYETALVSALFGIRCKELSIENLSFYNITAPLSGLLCLSADNLSLKNVCISRCYMPGATSLLAYNAGTLSIDVLNVTGAQINASSDGAGLINWVGYDAFLKNILFSNVDLTIYPDTGGSYFPVAHGSMLVNTVGCAASFENIDLYACRAYTFNSTALCDSVMGELVKCENIRLQNCFLLAYPYSRVDYLTNDAFKSGILFNSVGDSPDGTFMPDIPVVENNVTLLDSAFNAKCGLSAYARRGYVIENCVNIDRRLDQPVYE